MYKITDSCKKCKETWCICAKAEDDYKQEDDAVTSQYLLGVELITKTGFK